MKIGLFLSVIFLVSLASASNYSLEFNKNGHEVLIKEESNNYERSFIDSDILDSSKNGYYFTKKIVFQENYSYVLIKLSLDNGAYFDKEGIFPAGEIGSDGERIFVYWERYNVSKGESFSIFVKIIDKNYSVYYFLAIVLIVGVLFFLFKFRFKRKEFLLDTEKKVIELLNRAERREMWQRKIQDETGFSKAKLSRLIRNLESRGLIEKIPMGNTNKVRLV